MIVFLLSSEQVSAHQENETGSRKENDTFENMKILEINQIDLN